MTSFISLRLYENKTKHVALSLETTQPLQALLLVESQPNKLQQTVWKEGEVEKKRQK